MKIAIPQDINFNVMGVYKITFGCGRFYIGSSENIAERIKQWSINLGSNRVPKNFRLVSDLSSATATILEKVDKIQVLGSREFSHIALNKNALMLNKAVGGEGIRKEVFRSVAQVNKKTGDIIWVYRSASEASCQTGISAKNIRNSLCGEVNSCEKYLFIYLDPPKSKNGSKKYIDSIVNNKIPKDLLPPPNKGETIEQYDLSGKLIATYPSIANAAQETGIKKGMVNRVVRRRARTTHGFVFKYKNKELEYKPRKRKYKPVPLEKRADMGSWRRGKKSNPIQVEKMKVTMNEKWGRKIGQYSLSDELIKEHLSAKLASKELSICYKSIRRCASGDYKQSGGFIWKYHEPSKMPPQPKEHRKKSNKENPVKE